jgi:membrane protein required for colicin V production
MSTILGLYRGFLISSVGILSFVATIVVSFVLFPFSYEVIGGYTGVGITGDVLSAILSYILARIGCGFLRNRAIELLQPISRGFIDKMLGIWLGMIRGCVLAVSVFTLIGIISCSTYVSATNALEIFTKIKKDDMPDWVTQSSSINMVSGMAFTMSNMICATFIIPDALFSINIRDGLSDDVMKKVESSVFGEDNTTTTNNAPNHTQNPPPKDDQNLPSINHEK